MVTRARVEGAKVYVSGVGAHLPDHTVTNDTIAKLTGIDPQWIVARTGIRRRYLSRASERTSHLAARAVREALSQAGVAPEQVQLLLVASSFPDAFPPSSTAENLRHKLGLTRAHVVDVNTPLTGYLYALKFARDVLASGALDCAVVVGAEAFSAATDLNDRRTCYLFSDGAGAIVLTRSKGFAVLGPVAVGSGDRPAGIDWCETSGDDREPFTLYGSSVPGLAPALGGAIDLLIGKKSATTVHLVSQQVTKVPEAMADRKWLSAFDGFADCGYLLSASLPVSLYHLLRWGEVGEHDAALLFCTDGRGTWSAARVDLQRRPDWPTPAPGHTSSADMPKPKAGVSDPRELFVCSREDAHKVIESEARRADPTRGLVCLGLRLTVTGGPAKEIRVQVDRETRTILTGNTRQGDSLMRLDGTGIYAIVLRECDLGDAERLCARLVGLLEEVDLAGEITVKVDARVAPLPPKKSSTAYAKDVMAALVAPAW